MSGFWEGLFGFLQKQVQGGMSDQEWDRFTNKSDRELIEIVRRRKTHMAQAFNVLKQRYGEDEARELVRRG